MQECNFEPDYAAWWKKKELSKEEICWLMLGVNPEDAVRYVNLEKEEDKQSLSENDKQWQNRFTDYLDTLPYGFRSYREHRDNMKILSWEGDKIAIVNQAYKSYQEFPESFRVFLGKDFPKDEKLEAYKNHENFKPDETLSLDKITKEEDAFAVLLGFSPKDFFRFYALEQRQKNEPRDENKHTAYVRFTPDEKWFYSEYRQFITESYEERGYHGFAITAWDKARFLEVWKGNFKEYAQRLYNEGFIFKASIVERLKTSGIILEHEENGWASHFYKSWIKKGGWTVREAVLLFKGNSPTEGKRGFIDLSQSPNVLNLGVRETIYSWGSDVEAEDSGRLDEVLERYKAMGKLTFYPMGDVELFEPEKIVKWLLEQTYHIPPEPLLFLLGIVETPDQKQERILANTAVSEAQAKAKRKPPAIHECIGWAWDAVKKEDNGKPSAQDVWKKLQDNEERFTCIVRFDKSEKTKEQAIFWETGSVTDEMAFSTFRNIVSDLNRGNKTYDPSQNNF